MATKKLAIALAAIEQKVTRGGILEMGFLEGSTDRNGMSNAVKAFFNEFGTTRAPPRPAFRSTISHQSKVWGENLGKAIVAHNYDGEAALKDLGQSMRDDLESSIAQWSTPPNAESTIEKKGFNDPLIDTGDMQRAPAYRVKPK
jgi:hypothetical protein